MGKKLPFVRAGSEETTSATETSPAPILKISMVMPAFKLGAGVKRGKLQLGATQIVRHLYKVPNG